MYFPAGIMSQAQVPVLLCPALPCMHVAPADSMSQAQLRLCAPLCLHAMHVAPADSMSQAQLRLCAPLCLHAMHVAPADSMSQAQLRLCAPLCAHFEHAAPADNVSHAQLCHSPPCARTPNISVDQVSGQVFGWQGSCALHDAHVRQRSQVLGHPLLPCNHCVKGISVHENYHG